ncbi:hypothetical protein EVC08_056 [Rhizobium phage RHph_N65]|nr:hypothetical protein EVC08_056 [Rhizobium phage RHph_N65]
MPRKGEQWTAQERVFVNNMAATGDKTYSATQAGYKHPAIKAHAVLARPAVQEEIRKEQLARLFKEALPAAVNCLVSIITDSKAPAGARVQASKVVFDRTLGAAEGAEAKEPHEMTSEEIAKAIAQLEQVAFERAKPVENAQSAQEVRNTSDIFE